MLRDGREPRQHEDETKVELKETGETPDRSIIVQDAERMASSVVFNEDQVPAFTRAIEGREQEAF